MAIKCTVSGILRNPGIPSWRLLAIRHNFLDNCHQFSDICEMIRQFWRLTEGGGDNLGPAITGDGLVLGRTPLIERRAGRFVVREQSEIERLLSRAYRTELVADRLMPGLATVASALNTNDPCLARIAAVHLRIPDLPDQAARDGMEAADILIKSADWNPALHPRAGAPPNPGWFAPTDGSGDEASWTRTAQNDDPTSRSDAAQSIGENRIVLPPGERNDEVGDLLEWIANAKPTDENAIRAEIKRNFYDVGDTSGGDALTAALGNILRPNIEYKDRQEILNAIGPYSVPANDPSVDALTGASLLLLGIFPPAAGAETASAAWELGWAARGIYFSEQLGANLPVRFPVIDSWLGGIVTSIKSIDLRAATYQDAARLTYRLNDYVNALVFYDGGRLGVTVIDSSAISGRVLSLAVPKGSMTAAQRAAIEIAKGRAQAFGVDLVVTPF
jgi:hypothetical protein